jgi:hypothetical protein
LVRASRSSYQARICGQSVSSALAAVVAQGGDGGLDLVAARAPSLRLHGERRLHDAHALGDLTGVPQAAVLPVERDDATL